MRTAVKSTLTRLLLATVSCSALLAGCATEKKGPTDAMFDFGWNVKWFWQHIIGRGLLSVAAGSWFAFVDPAGGYRIEHGQTPELWMLVSQSWKVLLTANAWIGAAVGAGMIYASSRIRRWKDEG